MTAAAKENPWLRLARISRDHEENKRLWNGYQKYLLRPNIDEYQRQLKNPKFLDIVDLSDAEIHSIQTEIPDLPKDIGDLRKRSVVRSAIALTQGIPEIQTRLELDGFYFAFPVFIQNTTFKSLLTLKHAQFAEGLTAVECVFKKGLKATGASFGPFTTFSECRFNLASAVLSRGHLSAMQNSRTLISIGQTLKMTATLWMRSLPNMCSLQTPFSPIQPLLKV